MLIPTEFARMATCHGTVATISDPHEIANVLGVAGVDYMLQNAKKLHLNFISVRRHVFLQHHMKPIAPHWIMTL